MAKYKDIIESLVNVDIYNLKEESVEINKGKPSFNKKDYEIVEGEPQYFEPDEYKRSSGAIAILSKNTRPLIINKKLKYPDPYGWEKQLENKKVFERCHIIAYNLSSKIADKRNIFIGTEHLNTSIMIRIENKVKDYLDTSKFNVLYRVTVKYKDNNQIPIGVLIEAQAINDNFSVCEFCYNVQPQVKIDYRNGKIIKDDRGIDIIKKNRTIKKQDNQEGKEERENISNYIINIKTKEYHTQKDCAKLKNVESKYIQETTTTKSELSKADLKPCSKCND